MAPDQVAQIFRVKWSLAYGCFKLVFKNISAPIKELPVV